MSKLTLSNFVKKTNAIISWKISWWLKTKALKLIVMYHLIWNESGAFKCVWQQTIISLSTIICIECLSSLLRKREDVDRASRSRSHKAMHHCTTNTWHPAWTWVPPHPVPPHLIMSWTGLVSIIHKQSCVWCWMGEIPLSPLPTIIT